MRIGLWGARMDNTGLGVQTWEFYRHLHPSKTLVVDITNYNKQVGKITKVYPERYPKRAEFYNGFPGPLQVSNFLKDLDVVFMIESPYTYEIIKIARERGIKTVLQYNFEFLDYFIRPYWPMPDMLLAPSRWRIKEVEEKFGDKIKVVCLPVPVNREVLPFKEKKELKRFLHIAGHQTHEDRNGTDAVIEAINQIDDPQIEFTIRSQHPITQINNGNVKIIVTEVENYWELYEEQDVLLLPRKYGGLSLQLNEALSMGMVPLMNNMYPQNEFLDQSSLIDVGEVKKFFTRMDISYQEADVPDLVSKIKQFASLGEEDVACLNNYSNELVKCWDWKVLLTKYQEKLEGLCSK